MPSAPEGRERIARVGRLLAILAITAAAISFYIYRSPEHERTRIRIAGIARSLGRFVGIPDPSRKSFEAVVREIQTGDPAPRSQAIFLSVDQLKPADVGRMFPHLLRAMKDDSEMVRIAAAATAGVLIQHAAGEATAAEHELADLLDDASPMVRNAAAKSLETVARSGQLDAPPPRLVACLDDEDDALQCLAVKALFEYRRGPELIVPAALRRIPTETPDVRNAFTDLFWHVRLEPSVLPLLIEGLSSENTEVRLSCTAAINHMGREASPALPDILALIRRELDRPHPADRAVSHTRIVAMAAGAIGELTPDAPPPPGAVDLLCELLRRAMDARRKTTASGPDASASPWKASDPNEEFLIAEAVWSLGVFGRSAATSAPLLFTVFESMPEDFEHRGLLAESLAATSRGTPDEDRALASLAKAWKTAPSKQKPAIALALRSLGPKSERLVPELAQQPLGGARTVLRPVRYPRSRRGFPERE